MIRLLREIRDLLTEIRDLATEATELLQGARERGPQLRDVSQYVALEVASARKISRNLGVRRGFADAVEGVHDHVGHVGTQEVGMHAADGTPERLGETF